MNTKMDGRFFPIIAILIFICSLMPSLKTLSGPQGNAEKTPAETISDLTQQLNKQKKINRLFLGVDSENIYNSIINVDLPVSYIRVGYISEDLYREKGILVGDWVVVDGIGLIQIIGTNTHPKNTIAVKASGKTNSRHTYKKKVSWL